MTAQDNKHELSARLREDIKFVQDLSGQEVTKVGDDLNSIVFNVRALIEEDKVNMQKEVEAQQEVIEEFLSVAQGSINRQNDTVTSVEGAIDNTRKSIDSIKQLSMSATILAFNAKIESSRLGAEGKVFGVLSDQMRELSSTISDVTVEVEEASQRIISGLHEIVQHAVELQKETTGMIEEQSKSRIESRYTGGEQQDCGETRMDKIMSLVYSALGHLQFQDLIQGMKLHQQARTR